MLQIPSQSASMTWALDSFRRYARARVQTGSELVSIKEHGTESTGIYMELSQRSVNSIEMQ